MYAQPQMAHQQVMGMHPQQYAAPMPHQYSGAPHGVTINSLPQAQFGVAPQYGAPPQQQQHGAPQPQYGAAPQPQHYGAPPQPQHYGAPPQHFGVPPQYGAPQHVSLPQQYAAPHAMPQAMMPQAMPQPFKQAAPHDSTPVTQAMQMPHAMPSMAMPQAMPQAAPQIRSYTPEGGEMLQITVMGTRDVPGASNSTVHIQVPGKHDFTVETQAISGVVLQPKTTVTYIQPGDGLLFTVQQGGMDLGAAELGSNDFYPGGFEGEIPIGGGGLAVKITPLGTSGQIQQLAPVSVQQPRAAPVQAAAPIAVASAPPRLCSPEEFQAAGAQPGAAPVIVMTPEEMHAQGFQMQLPHHMHGQQPMMQR